MKIKYFILTIIFLFTCVFNQYPPKMDFNKIIDDSFAEIDGELTLYFFDAISGNPIENALVKMEDIGEFKTNSDGMLRFQIPEDPFMKINVSVKKKGYIDTDFILELKAGTIFLNRFSISPSIPLGHMRVVLDWGKKPKDLDAHFVKYNSYHISYRNMKIDADGVAMLDRDDTNGYGPETLTVTEIDSNKEYNYFIHDYSNGNIKNSDKLSKSNAEVKVFGRGKLLYHFKIPQNKKGNTWNVFKILNSKIIPVNVIATK